MNICSEQYQEELVQLGQALRDAREAVDMSMTDVAARLGVTATTIGKIERGAWNFSVGYLIVLSKLYGCNIEIRSSWFKNL